MTAADRIASALEVLVSRLDDPDDVAAMRVAELEGLLHTVVATIQNPQSTNDDWVELLETIQDALGLSRRVEVS